MEGAAPLKMELPVNRALSARYDALLEAYPGANIRNFDGRAEITELDALIAYLQVLGTMVDFSTYEVETSR